jgi:hypothetical protein
VSFDYWNTFVEDYGVVSVVVVAVAVNLVLDFGIADLLAYDLVGSDFHKLDCIAFAAGVSLDVGHVVVLEPVAVEAVASVVVAAEVAENVATAEMDYVAAQVAAAAIAVPDYESSAEVAVG